MGNGNNASMNKFGTSTKFSTTCGCGSEVKFSHTGPLQPDLTALALVHCGACGLSFFARFDRPDGKPARKVQKKTERIQRAILEVFDEQGPPMSVRQVFYQLSARGVVPKDDTTGYRPVQYNLTEMRRNGSVPYSWIGDNTRWQIRPTMYNGLGDALDHWQRSYRQDLWASQPVHVEIWIEKDALAGVVGGITAEFGVPLMVARGYSSISFAYTAAEELKTLGKPVYIYHFGDFDADGVHAAYSIQQELRHHGAWFHFERAAITPEQILRYGLMTRPQKKTSPRYKWWCTEYGNADNVELDALPPSELKRLVHNCITRHIDSYEWERTQEIEKAERLTLQRVFDSIGGPV